MINIGKPFLTYDPKKQKLVKVGQIIGDTLFREVKSYHFMRLVQGYGIQEEAFQKLCEDNISQIILKEEATGKSWQAKTEMWKEHGKIMDFGNGKQRFLSLKFMKDYKIKD